MTLRKHITEEKQKYLEELSTVDLCDASSLSEEETECAGSFIDDDGVFGGPIDTVKIACTPFALGKQFIQSNNISPTSEEAFPNIPTMRSFPPDCGGPLVGVLPPLLSLDDYRMPGSTQFGPTHDAYIGNTSSSSCGGMARHCVFYQECEVCGLRWVSRLLFSNEIRTAHNLVPTKGRFQFVCPGCRLAQIGKCWWKMEYGSQYDFIRIFNSGDNGLRAWVRDSELKEVEGVSSICARESTIEGEANESEGQSFSQFGGKDYTDVDFVELVGQTYKDIEDETTVCLWSTVHGQNYPDHLLIVSFSSV